ncbi:hypothetical protein N7454_010452 [Penicillium verhagenii]|nr:hypothetical protein N7454_010452 [Penicillium verhagenii]
MEDLEASNISFEPNNSAQSSPFVTTDDASDSPTDYSGHSLNESGPSTPMTADCLDTAPEIPNINVYYPYDIEEPDDELDTAAQKLGLPDSFERWQRDLIEYMNDLGNSPPKRNIPRPLMGPMRGQKRKSGGMSGAGYHSSLHTQHSIPKAGPGEGPISVPGLCPKRRRRRSNPSGGFMKPLHSVNLDETHENGGDGSSSSDQWSTDSSSDTTHESSLADEMDID